MKDNAAYVAVFGVVILAASYLVFAVNEDSSLAASLTVNTFVDTTIGAATLAFGSLNPATVNNAATENPVLLTNTANSNIAVDIYLNNTNMTSGGNTIRFSNMSINTTNNAPGKRLNGTAFINGTGANTGFYEDLAVSGSVNFYFFHDVPAAQTAGAYTSTVVVHSVSNASVP